MSTSLENNEFTANRIDNSEKNIKAGRILASKDTAQVTRTDTGIRRNLSMSNARIINNLTKSHHEPQSVIISINLHLLFLLCAHAQRARANFKKEHLRTVLYEHRGPHKRVDGRLHATSQDSNSSFETILQFHIDTDIVRIDLSKNCQTGSNTARWQQGSYTSISTS